MVAVCTHKACHKDVCHLPRSEQVLSAQLQSVYGSKPAFTAVFSTHVQILFVVNVIQHHMSSGMPSYSKPTVMYSLISQPV